MLFQCRNPDCEGFFEAEFFAIKGADASTPKRRKICRGCWDTRRDTKKRNDRWAVKARDTIRRHADRMGIEHQVLIDKYGWEPSKVAHRMEHAHRNGCCYCDDLFKNMGHGLADLTVDVIDPRKEPFWRINTNICCMSCNRRKGNLVPEVWAIVLREYKKWKAHRDAKKKNPWFGTLFENAAPQKAA